MTNPESDPGDRAIAGAPVGEKDPRDGRLVPGVEAQDEGGAGSPRSERRREQVHEWIEYDVETGVAVRGRP